MSVGSISASLEYRAHDNKRQDGIGAVGGLEIEEALSDLPIARVTLHGHPDALAEQHLHVVGGRMRALLVAQEQSRSAQEAGHRQSFGFRAIDRETQQRLEYRVARRRGLGIETARVRGQRGIPDLIDERIDVPGIDGRGRTETRNQRRECGLERRCIGEVQRLCAVQDLRDVARRVQQRDHLGQWPVSQKVLHLELHPFRGDRRRAQDEHEGARAIERRRQLRFLSELTRVEDPLVEPWPQRASAKVHVGEPVRKGTHPCLVPVVMRQECVVAITEMCCC